MGRQAERGDQGMAARDERELFQVEGRGIAQVGNGFLDGLALGRGACLRVQRDVATFFGRCKDGGEFHAKRSSEDHGRIVADGAGCEA